MISLNVPGVLETMGISFIFYGDVQSYTNTGGGVLTINKAFLVKVPQDPKTYSWYDLQIEDNPKKTIGIALFQARKLILQH